MADAVERGKVRAVGVSNYSADQMRLAHAVLADRGVPLASNQVEYSLLHRQPETDGVLDACRELGVTLIAYQPLASGALTGKYRRRGAADRAPALHAPASGARAARGGGTGRRPAARDRRTAHGRTPGPGRPALAHRERATSSRSPAPRTAARRPTTPARSPSPSPRRDRGARSSHRRLARRHAPQPNESVDEVRTPDLLVHAGPADPRPSARRSRAPSRRPTRSASTRSG